MATAAKTTPQDLPPKGGYAPFNTERVKLRALLSGRATFLTCIGVSTVGFYLYYLNLRYMKKHHVEVRSGKMAIFPLLLAERDRAFLKQINRNRQDEAELMKNVPDWEVGKLYRTSVYKTLSDDVFTEPMMREYYVHASQDDYELRNDIQLWS